MTGSGLAAFLPLQFSALSPRCQKGERHREEGKGGKKEVREGERREESTDGEDGQGKKLDGRTRDQDHMKKVVYRFHVYCWEHFLASCFLGC